MSSSSACAVNGTDEPSTQEPVILSVAFPYAPIGPAAVGGAEVLLSKHEAHLGSLGFRSVVVAHADSQPRGALYPVPVPGGEITDRVREEVERAQQAAIDRALAEHPVALVHMHGLDFASYRLPRQLPVLVTLHLPPMWYPARIWDLPGNYHFVCVSETERRACPAASQHRLTTIANGVELPALGSLRPGGRYALLLSRVCPEKNLHTGLDAARRAGVPAVLAGEVFPYPEHRLYFDQQIAPRVHNADTGHESRHEPGTEAVARFVGPVTGAAKTRLLARAHCLLLPSLAPETSSLVSMEALAAGVPVIGMASGAVPEIVEDGVTGFLLDPRLGDSAEAAQAMADAIARVRALDRAACRRAAEQRFGLDGMLRAYAALYEQILLRQPSRVLPEISHANSAASDAGATPGEVTAVPELALTAEYISTSQALNALAPSWSRLWNDDPGATPFQHPAWLLPWWRQFGADGELHAVALREAVTGDLKGVVPTYLYPRAPSADRKLLFIGAGTSDYLDGTFAPGLSERVASLAMQAAAGSLPEGAKLNLSQLRDSSPLLHPVRDREDGNAFSLSGAEPCSTLTTAQELPAKVRANAGRYRRRAEAQGGLRFSVAQTSAEALASFAQLVRFHHDRWEGRGEPGVLSDPRVRWHHEEAIPLLLQSGLLRMFRLELAGNSLGMLYALADPPGRHERSLYLYLIGFSTAQRHLSPGTLLLHRVWQYARTEGFARLDLLRGGEEYKHLWGAHPVPTYTVATTQGPQGS